MNRRKFLQLLGLTAPVVAVAPILLLAAPETKILAVSPVIDYTTAWMQFKAVQIGPGYCKYVRHAFTGGQNARAGDMLWFTDHERMHVLPVYFKSRQPPLRGHAVALRDMTEGGFGWVRVDR